MQDSTGKRLRIAHCTWEDPFDKRSFSGVHYHVVRAIEKHCGDVVCLGPIDSTAMRRGQTVDKLVGKLFGRHYDFLHSRRVAREFAALVAARLKDVGGTFDLIFAPVVSETIAYLETDVPIVYMADATFALLEDSYPRFSRLLATSRRQAHEIERLAIKKSARVIYASEWAAESAVRDYDCPREKIRIEPLGCNLDSPPDRSLAMERDLGDTCRLLFIAREWERKGGDIAIATVHALHGAGVPAHLTIIGCAPPDTAGLGGRAENGDDLITVLPYLDKNKAADVERYDRAIREATLLIAPTRRDCSPMVYGEAAASGVPSITAAVGGVPSIVLDGVNGHVLPLEANGEAYAAVIRDLISDRDRYRAMVMRSRDMFEKEMNWDRWGRNVRTILEEVAHER